MKKLTIFYQERCPFCKKAFAYIEELKSEIESLCLMHIHARFAILRTKGGLARKFKFVDTAFDYIEKNFPNWQNNPYYLKSRAEKLSVYPPNRYHLARDKRSRLKKYYTCLYIRRLPPLSDVFCVTDGVCGNRPFEKIFGKLWV